MKNNHVIIIIPMYNSSSFIDLAIESALNQRNVKISVVIVDHGSKDRSYEHVRERYCSISNLHLIRLERTKDERRSASRPLNEGLRYAVELASHEPKMIMWLMRLDSDDIFYSNDAISQMLLSAKKNTKLLNGKIIMYSRKKKIAYSFSPKSHLNTIRELINGGVYSFAHHATLISPVLIQNLLQRDSYCYLETVGYGEDLDLSVRLLEQCTESEIVLYHMPIMIKKLDGDTISNRISLKDVLNDHFLVFKNHRTLSRTLLIKIAIWYLIESMGILGKTINSKRKPPAYDYAEIIKVSASLVEERYKLVEEYAEKSYE